MALEQLSLGTGPVDGEGNGRQPSDEAAADDGGKTVRLPRWSREEILVMIRGKKAAENRGRRGRATGSGQAEPKWESVSSYCRRHGVNRGPVQCRKRWSNLAADYKKIKEWESRARDETASFWAMRNDLRRERKLPGFFDREVYEILDRGGGEDEMEVVGGLSLALSAAAAPEVVFDSGRSAAADDGLFSDSEHPNRVDPDPNEEVPNPDPISLSEDQTFREESSSKGKDNDRQPDAEGKKRKRNPNDEGEGRFEHKLMEVMDRNGELLRSVIESQNAQLRLDREQRDEHTNGLLSVLNKLADAMVRIADKL